MAVQCSSKAQFDELIKTEKTVLVDFYASWCGPCQMLAPIVEELSGEMPETLFIKVNIDDNYELASQFSVSSIPTLIVLKNEKVINTAVGYHEKEQIIELINS